MKVKALKFTKSRISLVITQDKVNSTLVTKNIKRARQLNGKAIDPTVQQWSVQQNLQTEKHQGQKRTHLSET